MILLHQQNRSSWQVYDKIKHERSTQRFPELKASRGNFSSKSCNLGSRVGSEFAFSPLGDGACCENNPAAGISNTIHYSLVFKLLIIMKGTICENKQAKVKYVCFLATIQNSFNWIFSNSSILFCFVLKINDLF